MSIVEAISISRKSLARWRKRLIPVCRVGTSLWWGRHYCLPRREIPVVGQTFLSAASGHSCGGADIPVCRVGTFLWWGRHSCLPRRDIPVPTLLIHAPIHRNPPHP